MISRSSVFASVNRARRRHGRKPLHADGSLARIGQERAKRAYRLKAHPGPGSFQVEGRWEVAAEALAWLPQPAVDPVPLWLASHEGHREIVLGKRWTHGGVGIYRKNGWTVVSLIVADRRL